MVGARQTRRYRFRSYWLCTCRINESLYFRRVPSPKSEITRAARMCNPGRRTQPPRPTQASLGKNNILCARTCATTAHPPWLLFATQNIESHRRLRSETCRKGGWATRLHAHASSALRRAMPCPIRRASRARAMHAHAHNRFINEKLEKPVPH